MFFRALVLVLSARAFSAPASAVTFGFHCITNNSASNCAIGEAQITVEFSEFGALTFRNTGPAASSVKLFGWEAPTLTFVFVSDPPTSDVILLDIPDVDDLPGGDLLSPPFQILDGGKAASPTSGLEPGEGLQFTLIYSGFTKEQFLAGLLDGSRRIGIEVQGFAGGGSESFINNIVPIPEPGSAALVATGLLVLARNRRRA